MSQIGKDKSAIISFVVICFTLLLCLSCNKKEVCYFAQGNGPDLVFEITPEDSAQCYISFQSKPYKLSEVNKEEVTLNGNVDISWKCKQTANDFKLNLKVNQNQVFIKDTFSLTISTLIEKKEKFFYYNDLLKNVPLFIANIKQANKNVDSLFNIRTTQQFQVTKINITNPLSIDLTAVVGAKQVSIKISQVIEEREFINPADFPGVK